MDDDLLAQRFEADRAHLQAVARRLLGSDGDADDAVQEAWLRLHRTDLGGVDNLTGWLTTVVSRVCLDVLRSRAARREGPWSDRPDAVAQGEGSDPEREALLADAMGPALVALLDPDVVLRADAAAVAVGAAAEVSGAGPVAQTFAGRARAARLALVDGEPGAVWAPGGTPRVVFGFSVVGGTIVAIRLLADRETLDGLAVQPLE